MNFFYLIFFFLILSCSSVKKEYVCGDHPCVNKKEFNEYFSKNLTAEIKWKKDKKHKNVDLVKINTESLSKNKEANINIKKNEKIRAKEEKKRLKQEKIKLLQERKIKKKEEKNLNKEEKKQLKAEKIKLKKELKIKKKKDKKIEKEKANLAKLLETKNQKKKIVSIQNTSNKKNRKNIPFKTSSQDKINPVIDTKKSIPVDSIEAQQIKTICSELNDCDIEKITELLIEKGRNKPFPNISTN